MVRTQKTDPFFDRQPTLSFIEDLKKPLHKKAPPYYGKREMAEGEIDARGIYINDRYPDDPEGLLETVYADLDRFFAVYGMGGDRYPVNIVKGDTECFEAHIIEITKDGITVTANDTEGVRRALIYIEDELRRSEAAFLVPRTVKRVPHIRKRITRCYFSPINRAPKFGDELSDDIDYYPEEYLNRLMHDGANGIWIYTRFSDLLPSSYIKENGKGHEARIAKLSRVIEKCRRYGIGVYVFAIEPASFTHETAEKYPEMCGAPTPYGKAFCANSKMGKAYLYEAGATLARLVPGLAGYISITYGEHFTSCSSSFEYEKCPICGKKSHGEVLSAVVEGLRSGMREVRPECETVSWTYGARERMMRSDDWRRDIGDYVRYAPSDVMLMQNFDDMGYEEQLGKTRQGEDYWLSYIGPSELFRVTAEEAKKQGKHMFAKMQVCCSHEIASVPYVPVPGIIYKKYKAAYELSVEGVMQCWYFGNFPSLMSKAAGELAFEDFCDEDKFLTSLAGIYFGKSKAHAVVSAWKLFEDAYRKYPLNIMFSYYGPMHDGVVWKLALKPKNYPLPRSWQSVDPCDGDRIYEALLNGHSLDEALTLCTDMASGWQKGVDALTPVIGEHEDETEQSSVARTIGLLFASGRNILEFYLLRDRLGRGDGDGKAILARMRELVNAEIANSEAMIPICSADNRLGYHSEAEGYKFFEAKLADRADALRTLLKTEFGEVEARIDGGLMPLDYYGGTEDAPDIKRYALKKGGIIDAKWEKIGDKAEFCASYDDGHIYIGLRIAEGVTVSVAPEFCLMKPDAVVDITHDGKIKLGRDAFLYNSLFGDSAKAELHKWRGIRVSDDGEIDLTLVRSEIGLSDMRPFKMCISADGEYWCAGDGTPFMLGRNRTSASMYGWFIAEG